MKHLHTSGIWGHVLGRSVFDLQPRHDKIFIFTLIILTFGIIVWHSLQMLDVKEQMERYLSEKYGKEFVVRSIKYIYPYLGGNLEIRGIANPVDDPNVRFEIVKDAEVSMFGYGKYKEFPLYIYNLWAKEARSKFIKILGNELVHVSFWFEDEKKELKGKTIHLDEAERLFPNRIELVVIEPRFIESSEYERNFVDFSNLFEGKVSANLGKDLYLTIQKLRFDNYKNISLFVAYYNQKYRKKVEEKIHSFFKSGIYDFNIPEQYLLCKFRIDNIKDITNPEDIGSHISLAMGDCFLCETVSCKFNGEWWMKSISN